MDIFEVFRRGGHKQAFEHCGTVTAPTPDMALLLARECYLRRAEGEHLWVVKREDIHALSDKALQSSALEKSYRFASAYRDVVKKRAAARARAEAKRGARA
jgi:ring-1,2-phenylacetyl-CoA epoxidase subunit PaaB